MLLGRIWEQQPLCVPKCHIVLPRDDRLEAAGFVFDSVAQETQIAYSGSVCKPIRNGDVKRSGVKGTLLGRK